ncbi:MAG TPA: DUF397 domain-containing protein [Streptosporangiaceae bacterium]|jgi:hypothetical protein|nr:DUF397 domain-containing protein [Streptosporangiaceae bacterium]
MHPVDLSRLAWRKSSYSGANGNCLEIAPAGGSSQIAVRDSKDQRGPALVFTAGQWSAFTAGIKDGSLDLRA